MRRNSRTESCHICGKVLRLTFEHLPPRSAFNTGRVEVFGIQNWLARDEDGRMRGGICQQRGAGAYTLCSECNSRTGRWYVPELSAWVRLGIGVLSQLPPPEEGNRDPDPKMARVLFKGVYPLRFLKQIITMFLSANSPDFGRAHHELVSFVLDREKAGLPERYASYLALFRGPMDRCTGLTGCWNEVTHQMEFLTEIAYVPFAYVMSIDTPRDVLPVGNISNFAMWGYGQQCDIELDMVVGFGHTPFPADYRSNAAIEADRTREDASDLSNVDSDERAL